MQVALNEVIFTKFDAINTFDDTQSIFVGEFVEVEKHLEKQLCARELSLTSGGV